jgi:hypothetical protein
MRGTLLTLRNMIVGIGLAVGMAMVLPDAVFADTCCTQCECVQLCCTSDGCGAGGGSCSRDSSGYSWWCYNPIGGGNSDCASYCI